MFIKETNPETNKNYNDLLQSSGPSSPLAVSSTGTSADSPKIFNYKVNENEEMEHPRAQAKK